MTTPAPLPPPGWYGAGVPGEERWWDGRAWAEHTRAAQSAPPRAATELVNISPGASLVIAIVTLVVALPILLFALIAFSAGSLFGLVPLLIAAIVGTISALFFRYSLKLRQQAAPPAAPPLP